MTRVVAKACRADEGNRIEDVDDSDTAGPKHPVEAGECGCDFIARAAVGERRPETEHDVEAPPQTQRAHVADEVFSPRVLRAPGRDEGRVQVDTDGPGAALAELPRERPSRAADVENVTSGLAENAPDEAQSVGGLGKDHVPETRVLGKKGHGASFAGRALAIDNPGASAPKALAGIARRP